jgi:hypothetical protein
MTNNGYTYLNIVLDRSKEKLSTEKQSQSLMATCCQQGRVSVGYNVLDVNGRRLLFIVGSKVLGRMSITVERSALNSTVLKNARGDRSSGARSAEWSATVR